MPRTHNSFSGLLVVLAITVAIGSSSHASAEAIFDFESPQTPAGLATPFSYTEGGITAIFSTLRSNPYVVFLSTSPPEAEPFVLLQGNAVGGQRDEAVPLEIAFSESLPNISLAFALNAPLNPFATLSLQAFLGNTLVGSMAASGERLCTNCPYPEGHVGFSGTLFDRVVLTPLGAYGFGADTIVVAANLLPEPGGLSLPITAIAIMLGTLRVKRGRKTP